MVFDGQNYFAADLVYPAYHHPHAPLSGASLSRALKIAYLVARRHGRKIIDQGAAIDFRSPSLWADNAMVVTAFARIAEGFRYIPDETTHLVGEAVFSIVSTSDTVNVSHRIVAVGAGTDTGSTAIATLAADAVAPLRSSTNAQYSPFNFSIYTPGPFVHRASFEVALSSAPDGAVTEVYVEAFATDSIGAGQSYFLHHCGVWAEIRG